MAFYRDGRYEGGDTDVPDLSLSDDPLTDDNRFGKLSTLIAWHCADPVSDEERRRHEIASTAQGNRNVFVDNPALVGEVYALECDDVDR